MSIDLRGEQEVINALNKVGAFDVEAAEQNAASALVGQVASRTNRTQTGAMKAGWTAQDGAFVNTVPYTVFQEFGTIWVEPMGAISRTWETVGSIAVNEFEKEVERAATQAGFDTD